MCGIAGFSLTTTNRRTNPQALATALLHAIEDRGPHATGAAWTEAGSVWWDKSPLRATLFTPMLALAPDTRTAILHTRYATHGNPEDNRNNHPHAVPGITGVHNGVLTNHLDLMDLVDYTPTSETDSEAIFAVLADPSFGHPTEALELVEGSAAVAWLPSKGGDNLHLARLRGRPLAVGTLVDGGIVFASTSEALRRACSAAKASVGQVATLGEGSYARFRFGVPREVRPFNPPPEPRRVWVPRSKGATSKGGGHYQPRHVSLGGAR